MSDPAPANTAPRAEIKHIQWDEIPSEAVNPLLDRQLVVGDQTDLCRER